MTEPRIAVVTGGASGIGEAAARAFAGAGWAVAIGDLDFERAHAVASDLPGATSHALDAGSEASVLAFVTEVYGRHGRVDALVNSAGLLQNAVRTVDMDIEAFDRIFAVNVRGTMLMSRAIGARMAAAGSGSIVNLCSLTSFRPSRAAGLRGWQGGAEMLTEIMAAELGPSGVRVNAVAPGYTMTPAMASRIARGERDPAKVIEKSALRRFVEPREVADVILFLVSDAAAAVTGATLPVDCGWLATSPTPPMRLSPEPGPPARHRSGSPVRPDSPPGCDAAGRGRARAMLAGIAVERAGIVRIATLRVAVEVESRDRQPGGLQSGRECDHQGAVGGDRLPADLRRERRGRVDEQIPGCGRPQAEAVAHEQPDALRAARQDQDGAGA